MAPTKGNRPAKFLLSRRELATGVTVFGGLAAAPPIPSMAKAVMASSEPIANTKAGAVRGTVEKGIFVFKGVRYGENTADRRFERARPAAKWSHVADAREYGNRAPQTAGGFIPPFRFVQGIEIPRPLSEDCLFLNVWTPGLRDDRKRPVMVWLHGGGYRAGSGATHITDGLNLSKAGDVVVISINHRINVFGYAYFGEGAGPQYADSGNVGMLDIVLALQWVRDNAAEFGGDSGNVTIFGESGGGSKVTTLMAMPAAQGLFHKAVVQSGSFDRRATIEAAWQQTAKLMAGLGLQPTQVKELAAMPMERLIDASSAATFNFEPADDGRSLQHQPLEPAALALSRDVPLLVGTTKDEMALLAAWQDQSVFEMTEKDLSQALTPALGGYDVDATIKVLKGLYPFAKPSDLYFTAISWLSFRRVAVLHGAAKSTIRGAPAYAYLLRWESPVEGGKWKSSHGVDVPLVFRNHEAVPNMMGVGGTEGAVSNAMSEAWINFARTGNPGWPAYDSTRRLTMVFDSSSRVVADPDSEERLLFSLPGSYHLGRSVRPKNLPQP